MILQITGGILRALMAAYGGKLVESGWIDSDQLTQATGAVIVLLTIGWSAWQKHRAATVPGGDFNPAAPVRRAEEIRKPGGVNKGFAQIRALVVMACFFAATGLVLCAGPLVFRAVPERIGHQALSEWIQVVPVVDKRPFWQRLWSSLRVTPSVAVAYSDGVSARLTKIELRGGAEF